MKENESDDHKSHPFYGVRIDPEQEQEYIKKLLKKYRGRPVNDELKAAIWDELQMEKHLGNITIPFKVTMRRDATKKFPDYVEVILDTKV